MTNYVRTAVITCFLLILAACLISCEKPKEGKVTVSKQQLSMRKEGKYDWVIDATGTVKNVGDVDVKNVVVTGVCESCANVIFGVENTWSVSNVDTTSEQMYTIDYIPVGKEKEFEFTHVAFMMRTDGKTPEKMPDKVKCMVLSFETAGK